jgi:uncharacterized protein (TIGR03437 family)
LPMTRDVPASGPPLRRGVGSVYLRLIFLALFGSLLSAANPRITLQVSNETAPPAGFAQFKISLIAPAHVSTASVSMTFDPTIFGKIANVAAFSATGDQIGYANVNGQQMTASFSSSSAGLGQLPQLPIFVVTVPVLANAKSDVTSSITVDPTLSPWQDQQGNAYTVSVNPGTFTVAGTLSIQSVTPGGGLLPAGTVVSIDGTGLDTITSVTVDGVSLASKQVVSAQQITITLGGATELTGKHFHFQGRGEQTDFFSALSSVPANVASPVFPILPLTSFANVTWQYPDSPDYVESVALLNQNLTPVTVTFFSVNQSAIVTVSPSVTIPPGELYLLSTSPYSPQLGLLAMLSSAPIRMLEYRVNQSLSPPYSTQTTVFPPTLLSASLPPVTSLLQPIVSPSAATWTWQIGTAAPSPITIDLTGGLPITTTISAAPWLSISSVQGTYPETFTLTPDVSSLSAGNYSGTVTIQATLPGSLSTLALPAIVLPVSIQVSASPFITAFGSNYFTATTGSATPSTGIISVSTSGTPAQFSIAVNTSSGGNWLSTTPTTGATPGPINVFANPSGLPSGTYMGNVVIHGPANSVTIPVEFVVAPAAPNGTVPLSANPASLTFALAAGTIAPPSGAQLVIVQPTSSITVSAQTQPGTNWLMVASPCCGDVSVGASAVGLNPGTYHGTVTITSTTDGSVQIPVTLVVLTASAPLTVTPARVSLTIQSGQSVTQSFNVNSSPSTLFNFATFTPGAEQWVTGGLESAPFTPSTVTLTFLSTQPGTHYGSVNFTTGSGSLIIPIVLNVTASTVSPPILGSVVSAASGTPSAISPGEIISLYGTGIGSMPSGLLLGAAGNVVTTLAGTQVMINNIAAPLIFASSGQVNAIVPYEVGTSNAATVQVIAGGLQTGIWTIPLDSAAPSIFTQSASGVGQGAIVNQDGSINSASNPASPGTAIQIYITGGGQTSPLSSTGTVAQMPANLALPINVTIGGLNAQVLYAGNAPGEVEGVVQINVTVPQNAIPGIALPILVTIGGVMSETGVTVAIQ